MKSGAIAVFLITVLSGCAGVFQNQQDDAMAQEPQQIDSSEPLPSSGAQADSDMTTTEPEARATESETPVAEAQAGTAEPDTRAATSDEPAAVTETREAEPESRTTGTETPAPESTVADQSEAEADQPAAAPALAGASQPSATESEATAEPAATASVEQGAAGEREAPPASQAETFGAAVVSSGTNGVIIAFANRPFADLSPHEHPPLNQEEYEQLQQVLAEKQKTEENTDRYLDEIHRGRTDGGVLAWFYRLWLI